MVKTESLSTDSSDRTVDVGTRGYYSKAVSMGNLICLYSMHVYSYVLK